MIYPKSGATKVDNHVTEEEISHCSNIQKLTIITVTLTGSEMGQDRLCLGCQNLQFRERNKTIK